MQNRPELGWRSPRQFASRADPAACTAIAGLAWILFCSGVHASASPFVQTGTVRGAGRLPVKPHATSARYAYRIEQPSARISVDCTVWRVSLNVRVHVHNMGRSGLSSLPVRVVVHALADERIRGSAPVPPLRADARAWVQVNVSYRLGQRMATPKLRVMLAMFNQTWGETPVPVSPPMQPCPATPDTGAGRHGS